MITWVIFIGYAAAMIYLGYRNRHAVKDEDFFTAARNLSGWSAGFSLSAGFMSISWSCVYAIQVFYWYGLSGFFLMTIPWMIALTGIYFLSSTYHNLPAFSQAEIVKNRFGTGAAVIVSMTQVIVFLIWGGAEVYVAANLLESSLGISPVAIMLLIALIIAVYSTWGGFSAVVQTDKLQFVFVAAYLIVVFWISMERVPAMEISKLMPARSSDPLFDFRLVPLIIITAMAYLPGWLSEADLWVRVQAARDAKEARKAALIGLVNSFLFVGLIPAFIAFTALSLFPPSDPSSALWIGSEGEKIIAALTTPFNNPWLEIFLAIGLLCASMSTIDTCTNIVSLNISRDLFQFKKISTTKLINAAVVAVTFVVSVNVDSLWDLFYLSSGLLSTTVALPVLSSIHKTIPKEAVQFSSIFGFTSTVFFYFNQTHEWITFSLHPVVKDTGLEYVVLGMLGAAGGFAAGYWARSVR